MQKELVELIEKVIERNVDRAIKWLIIYRLIELAIGLGLISLFMFIAWLQIRIWLSNI